MRISSLAHRGGDVKPCRQEDWIESRSMCASAGWLLSWPGARLPVALSQPTTVSTSNTMEQGGLPNELLIDWQWVSWWARDVFRGWVYPSVPKP
jgi:hypothetical protein